jgi:type IX secretion system PorP/SprF family membrane protein
MKRKMKLVLLLMLPLLSAAQDIHFSQYPYSPLNLSPASTGLFDGDIRFNALYRSQWSSVTVPYKTMGISYDQVIKSPAVSGSRNAAGVVINNDRAGDGNFGTLQAMLSFSRITALKDSVHFISVGAQAGIIYRSVDVNKLTFDNQFTGDVFNPLASTNENFDRTSYIYPDIHAGASWTGIFGNTTASAGFGVQHLIKPDQTFLGEDVQLPVHIQTYAGAWLKRDDKLSFYPSLLWMSQQEFRELIFGMEIKLMMQQSTVKRRAVSIGGHYRIDDAVIPSFALYYDQWRFGISYDINTSSLEKASNGRGGPELNLTYIMKKIRYTAGKNVCPVY